MRTKYSRKELDKAIVKYIYKTSSVIDIGCGIRPQRFFKPRTHICVDPHKEYIDHIVNNSKNMEGREFVYLNTTWNDAVKLFPSRSIGSAFIIDVIEHLTKGQGRLLIQKTEKIVKNQLIIFTPLGYIKQEHKDGVDGWGMKGGAWQEHKSGWLPEDFDDTWDIHLCEDYHTVNSNGEEVSKPFGAFYAVKTLQKPGKYYNFYPRIKQLVKKILDPLYSRLFSNEK